ncbi:hypothetical protein DRJ00_06145 [Candidatus Aerophobetes bacterium]|uniref:Uncharacterized protein n=1 Tax=Aerophobetes bacterium TaxID=2030807 RepID=A0A497E311_UNCAE|nr:MAG: hypothetical protein DRJ00_06145 [Candidatus Aerophobetes bacterium]
MREKKRDKDEELEELKKEVEKIVGKEKVEKIRRIVDLSYQFDGKPEYKVTYNVVKGGEKSCHQEMKF